MGLGLGALQIIEYYASPGVEESESDGNFRVSSSELPNLEIKAYTSSHLEETS